MNHFRWESLIHVSNRLREEFTAESRSLTTHYIKPISRRGTVFEETTSVLWAMTFISLIIIVVLLLGQMTFPHASGMEICERKPVSMNVCGGREIRAYKCQGACESESKILMGDPWFRAECRCCKSTHTETKSVPCPDGDEEKIRFIQACGCGNCNGAWFKTIYWN